MQRKPIGMSEAASLALAYHLGYVGQADALGLFQLVHEGHVGLFGRRRCRFAGRLEWPGCRRCSSRAVVGVVVVVVVVIIVVARRSCRALALSLTLALASGRPGTAVLLVTRLPLNALTIPWFWKYPPVPPPASILPK